VSEWLQYNTKEASVQNARIVKFGLTVPGMVAKSKYH